MKARHFNDTQDFSRAELLQIIELAAQLKAADRAGACPRLLEGASLGMLFEEPSTRTRVSFEVAMTKLGGHALYCGGQGRHLRAARGTAQCRLPAPAHRRARGAAP